jgi:hypothetical protein
VAPWAELPDLPFVPAGTALSGCALMILLLSVRPFLRVGASRVSGDGIGAHPPRSMESGTGIS